MKTQFLILFLFFSSFILAQEISPIETDRPDQTETPSLVPKGMFQVETGFSFQKNDEISQTNAHPSTLWKYGLNENFELRLITEFVNEKINEKNNYGLNPILVGCKIKIAEEKGIWPKTSFIGHISFPNVASSSFKGDYFVPEFRFVMQHTISDELSFSYNLGAEWNGLTPEPTFIYTVTSGYSFTEKFGGYIEIYGHAPQKDVANHNLAGGFTYLITNNFMVDISGGIGITNNAPKNYFAIGCSFRI